MGGAVEGVGAYMGSAESYADALIARLNEEDCLIRYKKSKAAVVGDAELSAKVAAFRAANDEALAARERGAVWGYDEERKLSHLYWQLMLNGDAAELLRSERETVALVYDILRKIVDATGIEDDLLL